MIFGSSVSVFLQKRNKKKAWEIWRSRLKERETGKEKEKYHLNIYIYQTNGADIFDAKLIIWVYKISSQLHINYKFFYFHYHS